LNEDGVLLNTPIVSVESRAELIHPPFAALFAIPAGNVLGNHTPIPKAMEFDTLSEKFILIRSPLRFLQCRSWNKRGLAAQRKWGGIAAQKLAEILDWGRTLGHIEAKGVHRGRRGEVIKKLRNRWPMDRS
jgi:hypothetical protein